MTDSHIYKMAYAQVEHALYNLIEACHDDNGKPRMPKSGDINEAMMSLPEHKRKPFIGQTMEEGL